MFTDPCTSKENTYRLELRLGAETDRIALARIIAVHARIMAALLNG